MRKIGILIGCCLLFSFQVTGEPSILKIDKSKKPFSSEKYINAVHKEIPTYTDDLNRIRYAILEGMLRTKGYAWVFEGEGDGYILARFDYRGDINVMRIEYNQSMVQLKYHDAFGDLVCKNLVDDICYDNRRGYYNYIKNLRRSIETQLKRG